MIYAEIYGIWEWMVKGVWVQFGSGDMEDRITLGCFLVHLFSSTLRWISARYKWRRHGFLPPSESQVEVDFPHALDPPKGRHWAVPIGCGTYGFIRLRT